MKIWFRYFGRKPEVIDNAAPRDVAYILGEYQLAYAVAPGQRRHGIDKVWAGRKRDEPR